MIPEQAIQQVKEAARIEEVVGEFVSLKRKGPRFLALCPFHNEKTPSFNVSPHLGIFKCFGCGESGDSISFLQKQEHLSYVEAIRWLAKRYQIELPEEEATPEQAAEQSERESLSVIQAWAQKWSTAQLWESDEGKRIGLSYFRERGFRDDVIRHFQLGYVPEKGDAFARAAMEAGFSPDLLEKAGWIKRREDGTPWDFFQGRVTFPVHGLSGQVIAFGARTLRSDKKLPKYFNSPESVLYVKSRSLYGIHFAKRSIADQDTCYLVEGYTDVISLHQAGVTNVVASSGTSLTEDQVRLIKRYTTHVTILYDGDPAGIKASLRGIDLFLREGLHVKVVLFPDGEDPDSYAKAHAAEDVKRFLQESAQDFLVFKADLLVKGTENDPVRRAEAIHEVVESIALVPDQVLRSLYLERSAQLLGINEQALVSELNKVLHRQFRKRTGGEAYVPEEVTPTVRVAPVTEAEDLGTKPQERDLMRILLSYGTERVVVPMVNEDGTTEDGETSIAGVMFEMLAVDEIVFDDELLQQILEDYRRAHNLGETVISSRYTMHENAVWRDLAIDLVTERHLLSPNWHDKHRIYTNREQDSLLDGLEEAVLILKERRVDRMIREKQELLRTTEDVEELLATMQEIKHYTGIKMEFAKRTGRVVVG